MTDGAISVASVRHGLHCDLYCIHYSSVVPYGLARARTKGPYPAVTQPCHPVAIHPKVKIGEDAVHLNDTT